MGLLKNTTKTADFQFVNKGFYKRLGPGINKRKLKTGEENGILEINLYFIEYLYEIDVKGLSSKL